MKPAPNTLLRPRPDGPKSGRPMTVFFPRGPQIGGFRPEFPAPTVLYPIVFIISNPANAVQLNGRLDYRSKLGNNASLTEGSCSKGIDAY